jgi:hypothetical protein
MEVGFSVSRIVGFKKKLGSGFLGFQRIVRFKKKLGSGFLGFQNRRV